MTMKLKRLGPGCYERRDGKAKILRFGGWFVHFPGGLSKGPYPTKSFAVSMLAFFLGEDGV